MFASSTSIALAGSPAYIKARAYRKSTKLGLSERARSNSAMATVTFLSSSVDGQYVWRSKTQIPANTKWFWEMSSAVARRREDGGVTRPRSQQDPRHCCQGSARDPLGLGPWVGRPVGISTGSYAGCGRPPTGRPYPRQCRCRPVSPRSDPKRQCQRTPC